VSISRTPARRDPLLDRLHPRRLVDWRLAREILSLRSGEKIEDYVRPLATKDGFRWQVMDLYEYLRTLEPKNGHDLIGEKPKPKQRIRIVPNGTRKGPRVELTVRVPELESPGPEGETS
jgi:hypothetical protein